MLIDSFCRSDLHAVMGSEDTKTDHVDSVTAKLRSTTESSPVIKFDISLHAGGGTDAADGADCDYQYQPGEELSGDVVVVLASPMRVSSIVVELRGEATVAWKTGEQPAGPAAAAHHISTVTTSTRRSYSVNARYPTRRDASSRWYEASELYVDEQQDILVGADDDVLGPGEHRFPLSFQLPRGLPTSFHGKFGGVSYSLRASFVEQKSSLTRRVAGCRHVVSAPFLVRRPSPAPPPGQTNTKPVTVTLRRRLFAGAPFICASGLLRVDFRVTDGTTYQLGDDVRVTARVMNDSPRMVVGVVVSLVQLCEYRAQSARRRCVALVSRRCDAEGRLTQVGYADSGRSANFRLSVPSDLVESRLDGCDVIDVGYELRFTVEVVISDD